MKESPVLPAYGLKSGATRLRTLSDLPGPRDIPVLGNALDIDPDRLHQIVSGWAEEFGPLYVFRVATTRILTVADAQTIQQLLRDRPDRFSRWHRLADILADIEADGLFAAEGAKWRRQRIFLMHALNASHVREFIPRMEEVAGRLRRRWWREAMAGRSVDVYTDLMRLTVDVTSGLAFGKDINTLEEKADPIQVHLDKMFPAIARRQTALFPYWRYIQLPKDRDLTMSVKAVGEFIDGLITETRARLTSNPELVARPRNLLEVLVAAQEREDGGLSRDEIAANVMTLLLAGEDTTAITISYMIHFLMENAHVQAAVQEEVDRVLGMSDQPWQDPQTPDRLKYIEAVANEAMRCKPVGGHLFLEPNEDVQIGDVLVPKGTPILALSGQVGLQDENFSHANEFQPERWLRSDEETVQEQAAAHNTKAFMPFGAGPRFCPGRQLAMLQIKMVISMLCRDFVVARPKDAPVMEDIYHFTVGPNHVYTNFSPRRSVRGGIDIEFREQDRQTRVIPIDFPERRVAERRKQHTAATG